MATPTRSRALVLAFPLLAALVLLACACQGIETMATGAAGDRGLDGYAADEAARAADKSAAPMAEPGEVDAVAAAAGRQERMLIHRGSVTVEVARVDDAIAEFLAKVQEWGGYLGSQQQNTVTVRVPAERFEVAFETVRRMGRVLSESREAADVTEEYLDVGIRLDNARRSRERLLELLAKADKVEDMLKIEEQLRRLTEEIERLEGRQRYLQDQVALSTLQATFTNVAPLPDRPAGSSSVFPWIRQLGAERLLGRP